MKSGLKFEVKNINFKKSPERVTASQDKVETTRTVLKWSRKRKKQNSDVEKKTVNKNCGENPIWNINK